MATKGYFSWCFWCIKTLAWFKPLSIRINNAEEALTRLKDSVEIALTAPMGPVSVEIPIDIQRTLVCLTAESIKKAIKEFQISVDEAIFCGGGVKNNLLMNEIKSRFKGIKITTTSDYGIDIDFLEAAAFAHLAKTTLSKKTGNIISVTGAKKKEILGGIYLAGNH